MQKSFSEVKVSSNAPLDNAEVSAISQKQALLLALNYIEVPFTNEAVKEKAARVFFLIAWLEDINWHPEAHELGIKAYASEYLKDDFAALEEDEEAIQKIYRAVSLFNHIYGWGLSPNEWKATQGAELVDELWQLSQYTEDEQMRDARAPGDME